MLRNEGRRGVGQPIGKADLGIFGSPENGQKRQVGRTRILDKVSVAFFDVADIARPEIGRLNSGPCADDGHPRLTSQIVLPFGGVGMPVQLPNRSEEHTSELQSLAYLVC